MSKFNFDKVIANMEKVHKELPPILANLSRNYFLSSFKSQGWAGSGWPEVDRRKPDTNAYKYPSKPKASSRTSPILIRTGKLRRAVSTSVKIVTYQKIRLVVDMRAASGAKDNYAAYLNEGTDKMPQRRFIGQTAKLTDMQIKKIQSYTRKIWIT